MVGLAIVTEGRITRLEMWDVEDTDAALAKIPAVADVRERTGLSQAQFAKLLGVSVRTLQEWEQGRRAPSGAARTLILVAAKYPRTLMEVA